MADDNKFVSGVKSSLDFIFLTFPGNPCLFPRSQQIKIKETIIFFIPIEHYENWEIYIFMSGFSPKI